MITDRLLIESLSQAESSSQGTSLITYYLPADTSLWLPIEKLTQEQGTASNIKSRVVRQSVQSAIRSSLQLLKSYSNAKTPENGMILCAGDITFNNNKDYCL